MTLGEQIQSLRKTAGFSQEELGDRLGVARQSVSKWESDTTVPELEKLIAMSKLFGVSMGTLLGLEEGQEVGQELTERELAAVEEIARRLVPPQGQETETVQKPRKRWPWIIAMAVVVVAVFGMVQFLGRFDQLQNQVNSLGTIVSSVNGNISSQVRQALEEQYRITAQEDYEIWDMDLVANTVTFRLSATPREYQEGMTAIFSAFGPDFEYVEVPAETEGQNFFTAFLTCPLRDDITLSVGFIKDGVTTTQELWRAWSLYSDTLLQIWGGLSTTYNGSGTLSEMAASVMLQYSGEYKTAQGYQEVTVSEGTLRLWLEDAVYWSQEIQVYPPVTKKNVNNPRERFSIPVDNLKLEEGDTVILSLLYTDSAGRTEEIELQRMIVDSFGMMDTIYEESGYPWEK